MMVTELPWDDRSVSDDKAEKLIKEKVLELTLFPHRKKRQEIADVINRSKSKVYRLQKELVNEGKLKVNESGHIVRSANADQIRQNQDISKTDFANIPSVQRWISSMRRANVTNINYHVVNFWKVCRTLKKSNTMFAGPKSFLQDTHEVEPLIDEFVERFKKGQTEYLTNRTQIDPVKQSQSSPQHYIESIRSFIKRNGKQIPQGNIQIQRDPNLIYSNIKLTDTERLKGIKFMEKTSENLKNLFIMHNEIGPRTDTLFTMKPKFERRLVKIDDVECEYYVCRITEKKQSQQYEKLIITPKARALVKTLKSGERIHDYTHLRAGKDEYNQKLRELFAYLGKIDSDPIVQSQYDKGTEEYYLTTKPSHAVRHSCVHFLMRITGERAEVVSALFWEKPETLRVYAKTSIDSILQQGVCYYCNPPTEVNNTLKRFCTLRHALVFFNNGGKEKFRKGIMGEMIGEVKNDSD